MSDHHHLLPSFISTKKGTGTSEMPNTIVESTLIFGDQDFVSNCGLRAVGFVPYWTSCRVGFVPCWVSCRVGFVPYYWASCRVGFRAVLASCRII